MKIRKIPQINYLFAFPQNILADGRIPRTPPGYRKPSIRTRFFRQFFFGKSGRKAPPQASLSAVCFQPVTSVLPFCYKHASVLLEVCFRPVTAKRPLYRPCTCLQKQVRPAFPPAGEECRANPELRRCLSVFYQMETRSATGMNIGSLSVMPKASYQAAMWGSAPFTRHSPSECTSIFVICNTASGRMLLAHTPA